MLPESPPLVAVSGRLSAARAAGEVEVKDAASSALRQQAFIALRELLAGFGHADRSARGAILGDLEGERRQEVYRGLVTVLMRMVFVLYAEERRLLPMHSDLYTRSYSLTQLHAQLAVDRDRKGEAALESRYGAWARVAALFRVLHEGIQAADGSALPARGGSLFAPGTFAFLEGTSLPEGAPQGSGVPRVSDAVVLRVLDLLLTVKGERLPYERLDVEQVCGVYEGLIGFDLEVAEEGTLVLQPGADRQRSGSHYTARTLTRPTVESTLRPILEGLGPELTPEQILDLKICDPAMGTGAFLVEVCRQLGDALALAWRRRSLRDAESDDDLVARARRLVAQRCIYGVDKNELAVSLAQLSLWLVAGARDEPFTFVDHAIRAGDSLIGLPRRGIAGRGRDRLSDTPQVDRHAPFHWPIEFPEVFDSARGSCDGEPGGFDAFVGNPPWVSYAGRAAQPLDEGRRAYFAASYEAFAGYRNLQGLFVERCAQLLRPGGRIGLLIPSSMSEQEGYHPARVAHDRLCVCDDDLPDLGEESFTGVFQPCMLLRSTKRPKRVAIEQAGAWPIERPDLTAAARALIAKMHRPPMPPELFGERGLQSSGEDTDHLAGAADAQHCVALRVGGDIEPFVRRPPSQFADPGWFGARLRTPQQWAEVRVLIRQTARFPMATLSDGVAFRNSILAGFATERFPAEFLVAYLNSTPIRWLHYVRHRDARQGMPQTKIGHLRSLPGPPSDVLLARLVALGERLSEIERAPSRDEQALLDTLVGDAFDLTLAERELQAAWARDVR